MSTPTEQKVHHDINSLKTIVQVESRGSVLSSGGQNTISETNRKESNNPPPPAYTAECKPDPYMVTWSGPKDHENTRNMSICHKYLVCVILTGCGFQVTSLSTTWSQAISSISSELHTSKTLATLGVTLFTFGLGIGPLFFSPISEFYGRRPVYLTAMAMYCLFQLMTVLGESIELMLAGRFMAGFAGSAFMTVISGTFSDLFEKKDMPIPTLMFTIGPFVGPGLGPIIGGSICTHWGYRWIFKAMLLWSFILLILVGILVPETYEPILLKEKAERMRKRCPNIKYYAPIERAKDSSILSTVVLSPKRPLMMLALDPVIFVSSLYSGILLAIIYLFFVVYPIVFRDIYQFTPGQTSMTFIAITVGMKLTAFTYPIWTRVYKKLTAANDDKEQPEYHLPQLIAGSILVPIGLCIFAATIRQSIHYLVPIFASGLFGFGCLLVFNGIFSYIFDSYKAHAASATACNTFMRSIMAGVFPLFGAQLFHKLGSSNACFMLAGMTLIVIPAPIAFFKYGSWLREKSRFTPKSDF